LDYQDVLAELGVGSAHPGGFESTADWTQLILPAPTWRILEVGCGTGRTSLYLAERFGCSVVGVDVRSEMVKKARARGRTTKQDVTFLTASAERLPFPDKTFDLVVTESVNVFVRPNKALSEYHRVLVSGGTYVDVEMLVLGPVSDSWKESARQVYGAKHVPDLTGWKALYKGAGFSDVRVVRTKPVQPHESSDADYPDPVNLGNPNALQSPEVIRILQANATWLETHHKQLGFGIFICRK